jgi:hypothetical protein
MNDEEINRAIAEHLGWSAIRMSALWEFTEPGEDHQVLCGLNPQGNTRAVPNYCGDLNAMHEAEKAFTSVQCSFYTYSMREVITEHDASRRTWHATARQRAEAFLRTVGKWRGEE